MTILHWMEGGSTHFPATGRALQEPNGLLAAGGDLSPPQLLAAYRRGIFPWYDEPQPVLWWSPDPRLVLFPEKLHVSRSMRKLLRRRPFLVSTDRHFRGVIEACAESRSSQNGTWITEEITNAYSRLHELGYAHSVEVTQDGLLVGGLYGVALGGVFFGESMFSRVSNASKFGFMALMAALRRKGYRMVDCQVYTSHLESLGAEEIPRRQFEKFLLDYGVEHLPPPAWPDDMQCSLEDYDTSAERLNE